MLSHVLWVTLARIILGLTPLITLPVLTSSFTTEWYGVWAQIVTTISFVTPLVGLGFDTGVVRYFATGFDDRERVRDFYSLAVFIVLFSVLLIALATFASETVSRVMFSETDFGPYAVITFVWVLTQGLYNYVITYFRVTRNIRTYALFDVANGLMAALIMVFVPLKLQSVYLMVIALSFNQATFTLILLTIIFRKIGFSGLSFARIGKYLKYGLPLVPNSLFLWLVNSSGRYFLTHFRGLGDVGIYSAGFTIANIMTLFFMPISFVLFPVISKLWGEDKKEAVAENITRANRWYLMLAVPGALGLSFLAEPIVNLLSSKEFAGGADVILFLTLANLFYGIYQINLYGALLLEKNLKLTAFFGVAGTLNVFLNFTLVPMIGLQGAALAMLLPFMYLATSVYRWGQKSIGYRLDWIGMVKIILSGGAMLGVLWIVQHIIPATGVGFVVVQVMLGIGVYALFILLTKTVTRQEIRALRTGSKG